jgi:phosphoribosylformylglycinamidine synthase
MEKLLLEACLEAMHTGAVVGIQDMGAAGLTCSTCEMGARGGVGLDVELDLVPQRETGMNSYEIMLSESQERMLLVAEKGRETEVLRVFSKWGLDATIVGTVVAESRLKIRHHGELVADIPNQSLTDDAPLYHRPVGVWMSPAPLEPSIEIRAQLDQVRDYQADLKTLLGSANICSKRWVYQQYDSMVQTNTVQGPGNEGGVMRVKGTQRGLSMALDGNGRWCYLDPKLGASLAVAEAARKVACTGAIPVAATNCLNFGNPQKPEIMAQLSSAIDGIAEACHALGTPITGGNVSLYNETRGEGIYPTPVIGIVGIIEDVTKAVGADFKQPGDAILLLQPASAVADNSEAAFGSSTFAKSVLKNLWGTPPSLDLQTEAVLHKCLAHLSEERLIHSARDISDGGIAVALAEASFAHGIGAKVDLDRVSAQPDLLKLFHESASTVLISCSKESVSQIIAIVEETDLLRPLSLGVTIADRLQIKVGGAIAIDAPIDELQQPWSSSLESALRGEQA